MDATGQQSSSTIRPRGEDTFPFVGGALALDLVNTEVVVRGKPRDLLAAPGDVARWWQAARSRYPAADRVTAGDATLVYDEALLAALTRLRGAVRRIVTAMVAGCAPAPDDVATLNAVLRTGYHSLDVAPDGHVLPTYRTDDAGKGALLLPVALSAFHLVTQGRRMRLHKCANERCVLFLYDTTRSATRRWCSVACKDRTRKMEHYRRVRAMAQKPATLSS